MATAISGRVLKRAEKELLQSKVILRHLPPDFTEEKLHASIDPFPSYDHFYFLPGNPALGKFGCCRGYINFTRYEDIVPFRDRYDGLVLETDKGVKYRMIIELAPFQGIPNQRPKPDSRCSTIEEDPEYKSFMEQYEKTIDPLPSIDITYLYEVEQNRIAKIQSTPLVEFLKERRIPKESRSHRNKVLYAGGTKKRKDRVKESGDSPKTVKSIKEKDKMKASKDKSRGDRSGRGDKSGRGTKDSGGDKSGNDIVIVERKSSIPNGLSNDVETSDKLDMTSQDKGFGSKGRSLKGETISPVQDRRRDDKEKGSRSRERPDLQRYISGRAKKPIHDKKPETKRDLSPKTPRELEQDSGSTRGKSRSAYSRSGRSRYNDRYDNYYYDDDDYRGTDTRYSHDSKGRRGGGRDYDRYHTREYDYDDKGGGVTSGRYYGNDDKGRGVSSSRYYSKGKDYGGREARYYSGGRGKSTHSSK